MIKINLRRGKKATSRQGRRRRPRAPSGAGRWRGTCCSSGILLLGVAVAGGWWWMLQREHASWTDAGHAEADRELERLDEVRKKGDEYKKQKDAPRAQDRADHDAQEEADGTGAHPRPDLAQPAGLPLARLDVGERTTRSASPARPRPTTRCRTSTTTCPSRGTSPTVDARADVRGARGRVVQPDLQVPSRATPGPGREAGGAGGDSRRELKRRRQHADTGAGGTGRSRRRAVGSRADRPGVTQMLDRLPFYGQVVVFLAMAVGIVAVAYYACPDLRPMRAEIAHVRGGVRREEQEIREGPGDRATAAGVRARDREPRAQARRHPADPAHRHARRAICLRWIKNLGDQSNLDLKSFAPGALQAGRSSTRSSRSRCRWSAATTTSGSSSIASASTRGSSTWTTCRSRRPRQRRSKTIRRASPRRRSSTTSRGERSRRGAR